MAFRVIFDAADQGYSTWWFPAFGLVFVGYGALLVFKPVLMQRLLPAGPKGRARAVFSWFFLIAAVAWTLGTLVATYAQYENFVMALRSGRYEVVEGRITRFIPMPYAGHSVESFVVGGRRFCYSDYIVTSAFNHTASHGGPIREGLAVRIAYVGNAILRIEVAQ